MKSNTSNILIIKGGYSTSGVGEQFVESLLSGYDNEGITRFSIITSETSLEKNSLGYPTITFQSSFSSLPLLSSLHYWKFVQRSLNNCIERIKELIEERNIQMVWIILNGLYTIQVAAGLTKHLKIPYVAHIWDTPEYKSDQIKLDFITKKHLLDKFDQVLYGASHIISISDSMGRIYEKKYGKESSTMVFCPPKESIYPVRLQIENSKEIDIVFAGSLYAYKEWSYFLDAIEEYNILDQERNLNVMCIGPVSRWAKKRDFVSYEMLKPIKEAAQIINKADIAYLPYWMSEKYSYAVRTAFPSKMSMYVASGTPVLFHGPEESTPTEFLNQYKVGVSCSSIASNDIIDSIHKILSVKFQNQYVSSREVAMNNVFRSGRSSEIFEETVRRAMSS